MRSWRCARRGVCLPVATVPCDHHRVIVGAGVVSGGGGGGSTSAAPGWRRQCRQAGVGSGGGWDGDGVERTISVRGRGADDLSGSGVHFQRPAMVAQNRRDPAGDKAGEAASSQLTV